MFVDIIQWNLSDITCSSFLLSVVAQGRRRYIVVLCSSLTCVSQHQYSCSHTNVENNDLSMLNPKREGRAPGCVPSAAMLEGAKKLRAWFSNFAFRSYSMRFCPDGLHHEITNALFSGAVFPGRPFQPVMRACRTGPS